ncbi:MAG TPA: sulfite oxidase [Thermoplasmata archaeon]|nr:sulfite oxidase [Thermoplasmata archaeon]
MVVTEEPRCEETPLAALDEWITPTERYFVRNHLPVPTLRREEWRLTVDGRVGLPLTLDFAALQRLPQRTVVVTTECAGNSRSRDYPPAAGVRWRDGAVGTAQWTGVSLRDVLAPAGLLEDATELVLEGADQGLEEDVVGEIRYAMSLPREKALDPDTILALAMNGAPLSPSHGFPVRAIVPGWYGMASVKWITGIHAIAGSFQGHYRARTYVVIPEGEPLDGPKRPVTVLQVKSLITDPAPGTILAPGSHRVAGVAWSGHAPIAHVDVRSEPLGFRGESAWLRATLVGPRAPYAWVRWEANLQLPTGGYHVLRARATDGAGNVQPVTPSWNFRGVETNSIHAVPVLVRRGAGPDATD